MYKKIREKEEFKDYIDMYHEELFIVGANLKILRLYANDYKKYKKMFDTAPCFMNTFLQDAWFSCVVIFNKILNSNEKAGLNAFFNFISRNANKLIPELLPDIVTAAKSSMDIDELAWREQHPEDIVSIIKESKRILKGKRDKIIVLSAARNEVLAHLDEKALSAEFRNTTLQSVHLEMLEDLFITITSILNKITYAYKDEIIDFTPTNFATSSAVIS